jgi:Skp family chaperone for outer membrane proteins
MRKNPPPEGHDALPTGYKIPYSHYHDDPPEVRLAAELAQRRERLAVQQKELEALEKKIKRSLEDDAKREQ